MHAHKHTGLWLVWLSHIAVHVAPSRLSVDSCWSDRVPRESLTLPECSALFIGRLLVWFRSDCQFALEWLCGVVFTSNLCRFLQEACIHTQTHGSDSVAMVASGGVNANDDVDPVAVATSCFFLHWLSFAELHVPPEGHLFLC